MGIKNLSKILNTHSPPIKREINYFSNKRIAIDASMVLYQCLIAIRINNTELESSEFKNAHLMGLYYKLIKFIENRINIIFIFDGKPPKEKTIELLIRNEKREKALIIQKQAEDEGDINLYKKMEKRQVKIEERHINEAINLLKLMGIPLYIAPGEAEAFCVFLYKKGKIDYISSEDMDTITYGGNLIRNLNNNDKKKPIMEYNYNKILKDLKINSNEFIDLSILLGCDYTGTLRNIGPLKSLSLIKEYKTIENILKEKKYDVISKLKSNKNKEEDNFNYKMARKIFKNEFNEIDLNLINIKYFKPNYEGIYTFLCKEKGFNEEKIKRGIERIIIAKKNIGKKRITDFLIKK